MNKEGDRWLRFLELAWHGDGGGKMKTKKAEPAKKALKKGSQKIRSGQKGKLHPLGIVCVKELIFP